MTPDLFRKLAALGLDNDQIAGVLDIMDADAENRKEKGRQRWRKWKDGQGANVSKRLPTTANVSSQLVRAEGSSSTQEISEKEGKKESTSPPARSTRGTRIPDDFKPDIEAAIAEGLSRQEAERCALSFCDYWRSKPGAAALKLDWPATWRMWFRRRLDERPKSTAPPKPPEQDFNTILDAMQGKPNVPQHSGPTIETSYERGNRSGVADIVQLHAVSARG